MLRPPLSRGRKRDIIGQLRARTKDRLQRLNSRDTEVDFYQLLMEENDEIERQVKTEMEKNRPTKTPQKKQPYRRKPRKKGRNRRSGGEPKPSSGPEQGRER